MIDFRDCLDLDNSGQLTQKGRNNKIENKSYTSRKGGTDPPYTPSKRNIQGSEPPYSRPVAGVVIVQTSGWRELLFERAGPTTEGNRAVRKYFFSCLLYLHVCAF